MSRRIAAFARFAVVVTLLSLASTYLLWGQGAVTTGTIVGDVADASGAVLSRAKITVTNQATGVRRDVVTDSNGHFVVSQVPAAHYEITVTAAGFKESVVHGFQVNVDATAGLKVNLEVGGTTEKVEVSAAEVALDTAKSEVSNVIQEVQVRELPLNQRSFTAMLTQQPGFVNMTNVPSGSGQNILTLARAQGSQISSNGVDSASMTYLMDGVNIANSAHGAPGTAAGGDAPGVEAVQEFKVLAQNYSAAYGGSSGSVISFATRSGTNSLHGSVYEFLRNNKLDTREYFNNQGPQNPYKRNQFGGTLGGPIKKDKAFFFVNYEALLSRLTSESIATVPSMAARNGGLGGSSGFNVYDPWGNQTAISPGVQAILALYPQPNGLDYGNGTALSSFGNYQPVNQHYGLIRADEVLSSKDTLMERYAITDATGYNSFNVPSVLLNKPGRAQGFVLKWTRILSPNLVSTLSYSFQRSSTHLSNSFLVPVSPAAYTGNPARMVLGAINSGGTVAGIGQMTSIGSDAWSPLFTARNVFPLAEDLIYIRGSHTLKFGGQFTAYQLNRYMDYVNGGAWSFPTLNDFLAGQPSVLVILRDDTSMHKGERSKWFAWYMEDTWRIKRNLTLTLGVRHEFQAPLLSETHSPSRDALLMSRTSLTPVFPFPNFTKKHFGPRVGIAYDPFGDGKTLVRAGFGMFYDTFTPDLLAGYMDYAVPGSAINTLFGITLLPVGSRGTPSNLPPGFAPIPFPACPPLPGGITTCTNPMAWPGFTTYFVDRLNSPTSLQWNLQIERQLPGEFKVSAIYTGSHSYHVQRGFEGNSSLPCSYGAGGVPYFGTAPGECGTAAPALGTEFFAVGGNGFDANTNYNSGTFTVSKRYGSSVGFTANYQFTKAMSTSDMNWSQTTLSGGSGHSVDPFNQKFDYSESMFSIRHRFTANGIFQLPFGRGKMLAKNAGGIKEALVGGWAFNTMLNIHSGIPFSVLDGIAVSNMGDTLNIPDRPNMICSNAARGGTTHYFDPKCYAMQNPGYLGNSPRNSVRGPSFTEVDLSLSKHFKTSEKTDLDFRAEAFNLINHPNFNLPANSIYSSVPGTINGVPNPQADTSSCNLTPSQALAYSCNPTAGVITQTVGTPRQLQLALKFTF